MDIRREVEENRDYIVGLRRYFHENPEPSLGEYRTAERIERELDSLGIENERVGETGVIGYIGKKGGKTLGLRADIDALEIEDKKEVDYRSKNKGLMHACGHDGHTAALLGAAKLLKSREDSLTGRIKLIFQQAEEIGQGARIFVEKRHTEDLDNVFGLHLASGLETGKLAIRPGPIAASCDYFKARIVGKSGHVSTPHKAVDALYIASQGVVNLQSIVARQTDPIDPVIVGIGTLKSGTRYNIIANEAIMEGTFRTFSEETREKTRDSIEKILRTTAEGQGGGLEIEFKDFASPLINEKKSADLAVKVGEDMLGGDSIVRDQEKQLGADDFAEFLLETPGVYIYVGSRDPQREETHFNHHHEKFDIDENAILIASEAYVKYSLAYFESNI